MTWLYRGLIFLPNEATYFFEVFGWYFIWSQAQSCIFRAGSPLQATHQACLPTRLVCLSGLRVYLLSFKTLAPSGVCLLSTRQIIWQGKGSEKYIDLWKASYGAAPTIEQPKHNTLQCENRVQLINWMSSEKFVITSVINGSLILVDTFKRPHKSKGFICLLLYMDGFVHLSL